MQLYLAVTPEVLPRAAGFTDRFAHVAYRIGPQSRLLRQNLLLKTRGGLLSLSDQDSPPITQPDQLCQALRRECAGRGYGGIVADFEGAPAPDRAAFLSMLQTGLRQDRRTLFIPESYAAMVPGAVILVCTALSGGQYRQRVQEAVERYGRVALDVERLAMDITVPAPDGSGTPLTIPALRALRQEREPVVFFSDALCARYFTYTQNDTGHFVLFDDAETLHRKIQIGTSLGCAAAFLMFPEVEDILGELFPRQGGPAQKSQPSGRGRAGCPSAAERRGPSEGRSGHGR